MICVATQCAMDIESRPLEAWACAAGGVWYRWCPELRMRQRMIGTVGIAFAALMAVASGESVYLTVGIEQRAQPVSSDLYLGADGGVRFHSEEWDCWDGEA